MRSLLSSIPVARAIPQRLAAIRVPPSRSHALMRRLSTSTSSSSPSDFADLINDDPHNNVTPNIVAHMNRRLLHRPNHPLQITKTMIAEHFFKYCNDEEDTKLGRTTFELFDDLHPVVSTKSCFDDLLIPKDHVSRQASDTYYVNADTLLRAHTSAHQCELISAGHKAFLCAGDVYRRDAIDASHYPVFHQMEGVRIFGTAEHQPSVEVVERKLKDDLEGMVRGIFGDVEMRWGTDNFPFTDPSLELEIFFEGDWLEVLGCGVIHQDIMQRCGVGHLRGYAFGLGLERLAMVLFDVPDIRLFWSEDSRFHEQFTDGKVSKFKAYSKFPACYKDISFWLPDKFHENDFYALVRTAGGELVEDVKLIDQFKHPKSGQVSHCYRILYRSMDRNLTNEEVDKLQDGLIDSVKSVLKATVR